METGGAAILARLRAQRSQSAAALAAKKKQAASAKPKEVTVLYASQTGTAQEIACSIQAECSKHGIVGKVFSCNELGFEKLSASETPVLVVVASSTGDGDAPDNAVKFIAAMKRKTNERGRLAGVRYTVMGLGDSNYTRFMAVSRGIRSRLAELGAETFYDCAEADEVDGLEDVVDAWVEHLWPSLKRAIAPDAAVAEEPASVSSVSPAKPATSLATTTSAAPAAAVATTASANAANGTAPADGTLLNGTKKDQPAASAANGIAPDTEAAGGGQAREGEDGLVGVPALAECRIKLEWHAPGTAEAQRALQTPEGARPGEKFNDRSWRDPEGVYSPERPFWARVAGAKYLTSESSERQVLHLELDISSSGMRYTPGDSVGILPQNSPGLVEELLRRLGADGDAVFSVRAGREVSSGTSLLQHLGWPCSLRQALAHGTDITAPPRKPTSPTHTQSLLRLLAEHCTDPAERRALLLLSSRGGRDAYSARIAEARPSLLSLLAQFPSCHPPLAALLDALHPLAPRMYSVASSPLVQPDQVDIAFTVVSVPTPSGTHHGVASTWLQRITQLLTAHGGQPSNHMLYPAGPHPARAPAENADAAVDGNLARGDSVLANGCSDGVRDPACGPGSVCVPIYLRSGGAFRPPASLEVPWVMIGPGTGVTPFRGFLQHRRELMNAAPVSSAAAAADGAAGTARPIAQEPTRATEGSAAPALGSNTATPAEGCDGPPARDAAAAVEQGGAAPAAGVDAVSKGGGSGSRGPAPAWLYFGCRARDQDYLYREELEEFASDGTLLQLHVAFSREQPEKVYVQHLMRRHSPDLHALLADESCAVYVCGDGAGMARDVQECLIEVFEREGGMTHAAAVEKLTAMARQGQYVRDIWS